MTSIGNIFFFFSGCSYLGLIFVYFMLKETKNLPLEAVTLLYSESDKNKKNSIK